MNKQREDQRLEEKRARLKFLIGYGQPGKIVEFGCGSGLILELLALDFSHSLIVGVDISRERLEEARERGLKNVILIQGDMTAKIFPRSFFDTVFFIDCLHEVFSYSGEEKVGDVFRVAQEVLKDKGVLIIEDFLNPPSKLVEMGFKSKDTRRKFFGFVQEFSPRKVKFERIKSGVRLQMVDALEFIRMYHPRSKEHWNEGLGETHFFFKEEEYKEIAKNAGFVVKELKKIPLEKERWAQIREDVDFESKFESEFQRIQLVLVKSLKVTAYRHQKSLEVFYEKD